MGFFEDVDVVNVAEDTKSGSAVKRREVKESVSISPDEILDEAFEDMMPIEDAKDRGSSSVENTKESKPEIESKSSVPVQKAQKVEVVNKIDTKENTIIAKGTVIDGSVKSDTSVCISGTVTGEVNSSKNIIIEDSATVKGGAESAEAITVSGTLRGAIKAKSLVVEGGKIINGDVTADTVVVHQAGVVIAPISAQSLEISGAVKGDISVKDKVVLNPTAIVQGNITSASISIQDGASIDGTCTQTYAKVKPSDFFNSIKIDE